MGQEPESLLKRLGRGIWQRKPVEQPKPENTPMAMLERLHAREHPDYCLYLRPPVGGPVAKVSALSVDLEELLPRAFDPLPMVTLKETDSTRQDAGLPDEAFLTLADRARVLCLVPTADARFISRLRLIKSKGPIARCIFVMPEQGTLGTANWPDTWPAAREAVAKLGIELSGYTAGGWLFRLDAEGRSCTFRPIVNPNVEKIARALESICVEMN